MNQFRWLWDSGIWAVVIKDTVNLFRDRQTVSLFLIAPLLYVAVYGFALNPDVQQVRLGVVDYAQTAASREFVSFLATSQVVEPTFYTWQDDELVRSQLANDINVALIIPPEFNRQLIQPDQVAEVQILIDGVDANRAGILRSYLSQIISQYRYPAGQSPELALITPQTKILYNPGLVSSWYFVPGVLGVILTGISTFAAAASMTAEKEYGTFDQLVLTPLTPSEILLGKLLPLLVIILGMVLLAVGFAQIIFHLPFRGSVFLFLLSTSVYIMLAAELGLLLGLISQNLLQAYLTSFFINLPLIQLSGAYTPIEAMPPLFQWLSNLNPLRHYIVLLRGILLKGGNFSLLWQLFVLLLGLAVALFCLCFYLFKRQTQPSDPN